MLSVSLVIIILGNTLINSVFLIVEKQPVLRDIL